MRAWITTGPVGGGGRVTSDLLRLVGCRSPVLRTKCATVLGSCGVTRGGTRATARGGKIARALTLHAPLQSPCSCNLHAEVATNEQDTIRHRNTTVTLRRGLWKSKPPRARNRVMNLTSGQIHMQWRLRFKKDHTREPSDSRESK